MSSQANYAEGSGNLEARAAIWSYAVRPPDRAEEPIDWFCDLVDWTDVGVALDVGCGSGRFIASLSRRARRVIALDLSPAMVAEVAAREAGPLLVGDVCRLPLRDHSADRVLAAWMLYHADDAALACAELRRVLRSRGALIAVTNAAGHTAEMNEIWAEATEALLGSERDRPRLPVNGFTLDSAANHLSREFESVTFHVRRVRLRVPTPEPIVAFLASLRMYADLMLARDGASFDDVIPHIEDAAQRRIERVGAVEVTGLPAALICS